MNKSWVSCGGMHINLANVCKIEETRSGNKLVRLTLSMSNGQSAVVTPTQPGGERSLKFIVDWVLENSATLAD